MRAVLLCSAACMLLASASRADTEYTVDALYRQLISEAGQGEQLWLGAREDLPRSPQGFDLLISVEFHGERFLARAGLARGMPLYDQVSALVRKKGLKTLDEIEPRLRFSEFTFDEKECPRLAEAIAKVRALSINLPFAPRKPAAEILLHSTTYLVSAQTPTIRVSAAFETSSCPMPIRDAIGAVRDCIRARPGQSESSEEAWED